MILWGEKEPDSYLFFFPIVILTFFLENVALIAFYLFHMPPQAIFLAFNWLQIKNVWQEGNAGSPNQPTLGILQ